MEMAGEERKGRRGGYWGARGETWEGKELELAYHLTRNGESLATEDVLGGMVPCRSRSRSRERQR